MKNSTLGWADAHSHLADPRIPDPDQVIARAMSRGLQTFLQGGVGPEDWQKQKALQARHPQLLLCFGLHPYWVSDHSHDECESGLDQLARELHLASALGETGLDFRPQICRDSEDRQISCFEAQLEMAQVAAKPVVLHLVRAHQEALSSLDHFGSKCRGLVHAFNGSAQKAEDFLKRDFLLSIGGAVCRPDLTRLHQAVQMIPLESLLVETDSPDQAPPGVEEEQNRPESLFLVAEKIAEIKGVSRDEVLDKTSENLRKLLSTQRPKEPNGNR